jgi:hypothetical protein
MSGYGRYKKGRPLRVGDITWKFRLLNRSPRPRAHGRSLSRRVVGHVVDDTAVRPTLARYLNECRRGLSLA